MYAICKTSGRDVRKCVERMSETGVRYPIFQTGDKKYVDLEKNQGKVPTFVEKKVRKHKVNISTRTIHSHKCNSCGNDTVEASIINISASGLKKCKKCMK